MIWTRVRVSTVGEACSTLNSGQASTMAATAAIVITLAAPTRSARVPTKGVQASVTRPAMMPPR